MKKLTFALATATALISAPALAADLRMPVKGPVTYAPPPPFNWSRCYIGAHVGGQWSDIRSSYNFPGGPGVPSAAARTFEDTSLIGGGQIGCNWQFSPAFMVGIEGDASWADHRVAGELFRYPNGIDHFDASARLGTQGSIRARAGFITGPVLFYATGGAAFADARASTIVTRDGVGSLTTSVSDVLTGWTAGGGIEWGFAPQWSAKVEYRYSDFGNINIAVPAFVFPAPGGAYTANTNFTTHDVRAGINFHF